MLRLGRWTVVGVAAAVAELALLRALVEGLHVVLPIATIVAAEVLILLKFLVADRWVFGHPRPALQRAVRYHGRPATQTARMAKRVLELSARSDAGNFMAASGGSTAGTPRKDAGRVFTGPPGW